MTAKTALIERRDDAETRPLSATQTGRTRRWTVLIERIAAGDLDACGVLYDESATFAFSLILQMLQDQEAAEAALLDLYSGMHMDARSYDRLQTPLAWVIGLARRAALARLRPEPAARAAAHSAVVVAFDPAHRHRQAHVHGEATLNEQQRTILRLVYYGGMSAREVAAHLGLRPGYVREEIENALRALRPFNDAAAIASSGER